MLNILTKEEQPVSLIFWLSITINNQRIVFVFIF